MKVLSGILMVLSIVIAVGCVVLDKAVTSKRVSDRLFYVAMAAVVIGAIATMRFCWPS